MGSAVNHMLDKGDIKVDIMVATVKGKAQMGSDISGKELMDVENLEGDHDDGSLAIIDLKGKRQNPGVSTAVIDPQDGLEPKNGHGEGSGYQTRQSL
ncbi:hypothetical protein JCGZ_10501 [Jatropha curcas]|uniref:Uncharacterized protein n=1 Tax=Jatropha curcas TaxID=180498 RepID=A0A067KV88_JATCU|nr:hypothetical protein JCGZ_10501 [Jatropha curcas]